MIISKTQPPPVGVMGGSVHSWERSLDPWHADAFKGCGFSDNQLKNAVCVGSAKGVSSGVRREGWDGLDWCGNVICFVPDGAELVDKEERKVDKANYSS